MTDSWPPPNYRPDYGTGYRVTLADFRQLVTDPAYRDAIQPLLSEWFGGTLPGAGEGAEISGPGGTPLTIEDLHARIQADPEMQYRLYQRAMDLWR